MFQRILKLIVMHVSVLVVSLGSTQMIMTQTHAMDPVDPVGQLNSKFGKITENVSVVQNFFLQAIKGKPIAEKKSLMKIFSVPGTLSSNALGDDVSFNHLNELAILITNSEGQPMEERIQLVLNYINQNNL